MARVRGADKHSDRLKRMTSSGFQNAIGKAIYAGADIVRVEAHRSIANGAIQGKGHVPSKPGEPPNWDTGQLATSIINRRTGQYKAETASQAPYSAPLEFSSSKMAERPFMKPAAMKSRSQIEQLVQQVVRDYIAKVAVTAVQAALFPDE